MKARNINDDSTLAYLFNKTKQSAADALESIKSLFVKKSGDTMTDTLSISKDTTIAQNYPSAIYLKPHQTDNDLTYTGCYVAAYDDHDAANNGVNMVIQGGGNLIIGGGESPGNLYAAAYKDSTDEKLALCGDSTIEFFTNCQTIANRVNTRIDASGNFSGKAANVTGTVAVANGGTGATTAADARTNLGAVNKAGDTMSGSLDINVAGTPHVYFKNTQADTSLATDTAVRYWSLFHRDKNNKLVAYWESSFSTAGLSQTELAARRIVNGSDVSNNLSLRVAADGTRSIAVSDAAPWRSALGLGTSGALPITIGQGGTGQTGINAVTTPANVITAASGFTIYTAEYKQWGKVAQVFIGAYRTSTAITTDTDSTVGTMVTGKRPINQCAAVGIHTNVHHASIGSSGNLIVNGKWPTTGINGTMYFLATYLLP